MITALRQAEKLKSKYGINPVGLFKER